MTPWIVPIAVALLAPLFAYLGVIRKLSGRIDTSEAAILWQEASTMREEWRQRAIECEVQLKACRNEVQTLTARNTILRRENEELKDHG